MAGNNVEQRPWRVRRVRNEGRGEPANLPISTRTGSRDWTEDRSDWHRGKVPRPKTKGVLRDGTATCTNRTRRRLPNSPGHSTTRTTRHIPQVDSPVWIQPRPFTSRPSPAYGHSSGTSDTLGSDPRNRSSYSRCSGSSGPLSTHRQGFHA